MWKRKYLTIITMTGLITLIPDYALILIGTNMGVQRMTKEHLGIRCFIKHSSLHCIYYDWYYTERCKGILLSMHLRFQLIMDYRNGCIMLNHRKIQKPFASIYRRNCRSDIPSIDDYLKLFLAGLVLRHARIMKIL